MDWKRLPRERWQAYFDEFSKHIRGERVEIELRGLERGGEFEYDWALLSGLTYDSKSEVFEVQTRDLDHMISRPSEVEVAMENQHLQAVKIVAEDGHEELLKLRSPLVLPLP